MISPAELMLYVTPVLLLIDRLVGERLAQARAAKAAAQITKAQVDTSQEVSAQVRYSSQQNAVQSANLTAKALAPAQEANVEKLETIHGLVNGTLTAANEKVAALQAELDALKKKTS